MQHLHEDLNDLNLHNILFIAQNTEMKMVGSDWLVANLNVSGYYRVNYDMENWNKLLHLLQTAHEVPTS